MGVVHHQAAYTVMTDNRTQPEANKYYRPKLKAGSDDFRKLTKDTVRRHLRGEITCMFYAADPQTQRSKWVCVDADYSEAAQHLLILKDHFTYLGLAPLLEESRRGGHLWLFADQPLLSVQLRSFLLSVIADLKLPIFSSDVSLPGLEVFPRQDSLEAGRFGNGVRGPLGVHRKDFKRYWFQDASKSFLKQFSLLIRSRTLTQSRLITFTDGFVRPLPPVPSPSSQKSLHPRQAFSIFDHFPPPRSSVSDFKVSCPCCFEKRLVITAKGARRGFYHCFTGCSTAAIRAALGQPLSELRRGIS